MIHRYMCSCTPHNTTPHNTTPHNTTPHNITPHNTPPHNTTPHNTPPHNIQHRVGRGQPRKQLLIHNLPAIVWDNNKSK